MRSVRPMRYSFRSFPYQQAKQIAWAINLRISIMTTRTEKFQRKPRDGDSEPAEAAEAEEILRFSPEEEAVCITNPLRYVLAHYAVLMICMVVSPRRIQ